MATRTLAPDGVGDETAIQNLVGAATHWQAVLTNDDDTSYVERPDPDPDNLDWFRDLYTLENSINSGIITNIRVLAIGRIYNPGVISSGVVQLSLKIGGSVFDSATKLFFNWYTQAYEDWAVNPFTSSAWTWDEINALQAGLRLRRRHDSIPVQPRWVRCTQVYVVVTHALIGYSQAHIIG